MLNKVMAFMLGLVLFGWGFIVALKRAYYSSRYSRIIDFGELHVVIGIFMMLVGIAFIYTSVRKKKNR
jgi:membrane-bound acyltransferase YfiQ involved in biofilm formation